MRTFIFFWMTVLTSFMFIFIKTSWSCSILASCDIVNSCVFIRALVIWNQTQKYNIVKTKRHAKNLNEKKHAQYYFKKQWTYKKLNEQTTKKLKNAKNCTSKLRESIIPYSCWMRYSCHRAYSHHAHNVTQHTEIPTSLATAHH